MRLSDGRKEGGSKASKTRRMAGQHRIPLSRAHPKLMERLRTTTTTKKSNQLQGFAEEPRKKSISIEKMNNERRMRRERCRRCSKRW